MEKISIKRKEELIITALLLGTNIEKTIQENGNTTKKQHYVPQFYLRKFSDDEKMICRIDKENMDNGTMRVPISSVCYINDLYEFSKELCINGINYFENRLSGLESIFSVLLKEIEKKACIKSNLDGGCFLTFEEKVALKFFTVLQYIRCPIILETWAETLSETYGNLPIEGETTYDVSLMQALPFYRKWSEHNQDLFTTYIRKMDNMAYAIGITNKDCIFTSDFPVSLYEEEKVESVMYPLSSRMILFLEPKSKENRKSRNFLFELTEKQIEEANKRTTSNALRWVFSKQDMVGVV